MKTLKLSRLIELKACQSQIDLFKAEFGDEVEITTELCVRYSSKFDWNWASLKLLNASARKLYDETCASAGKLYDETRTSSQKLYDETCEPAWKLYDETRAPAQKLYDETCAAARKLYDETCAPAGKLYDETCAAAFAEAYMMEN